MPCCETDFPRGECCDASDPKNLAPQLNTLSDSALQTCWNDTTVLAVQRRCLSLQELAEMSDMLSVGGEEGSARETTEAQLRVLLDRIDKAPDDDRPIQPLAVVEGPSATSRNSMEGIAEFGLTRTGRYDLRPGDRVSIHALSERPGLNGCAGVLIEPAFDIDSGRCCVRVDHGCVGVVRVRPARLKLVLYAWDEAAVQFVRPSGALTSRTVGWCRTNGFDEVRPGVHGELPVFAGPWWEEMDAVERARVLVDAMSVDDAEGDEPGGEPGGETGGEGGDDIHDEFLKGLSAGCVGMEVDLAGAGPGRACFRCGPDDVQTDDEDDDFVDLAHEIGIEPSDGLAAGGFGSAEHAFEQLDGEWSFSPDDLDALARLEGMYQPLSQVA